MSETKTWLPPDAEDIKRVAAKHRDDPDVQRLILIAESASWMVRMHRSLRGTDKIGEGVYPPGIAWSDMVAALEGREVPT